MEILKDLGELTVPFAIGKWLYRKVVLDEIQKVAVIAEGARREACEANESLKRVPETLSKYSQEVSANLNKMTVHYADAVKITAEAKSMIEVTRTKYDVEIREIKMAGGRILEKLHKNEAEIKELGKVIVVGDKKK